MTKITVKVSEEYQVKVSETPNDDEFFYRAYEQARNELSEIIDDTINYYQEKSNHPQDNYANSTLDFSNNIIAFSGDRGQGKSSAMLSFSTFLKNLKKVSNQNFFGSKIANSNFVVLERIDPTKLEDGDEILVIILAKLFHLFSDMWAHSDNKQAEIRGQLLEQFQNCYREIEAIKSKSLYDQYGLGSDLEKLGRIGDSANLKYDFHALLKSFFKFYCSFMQLNPAPDSNFLVIQLDDTDLKVDRAKEIVEDIRKYFMIPNVVILMAVDLKQLTYAIEQGHISQFLKLQGNYGKTRPVPYHEIAVKYIEKLIPGRRKVFLPELKASTDEAIESVTLEYNELAKDGSTQNVLLFKNREEEYIYDLQELLIRFVYEKTGLIFVKPTNYLHNIVPRTMRSLVNFLSILNNMPSLIYDNNGNLVLTEGNIKQKLENIEAFERYFKNTWIPNHVMVEDMEIIENFISTPWTIKSKNLLRDLKNKYISTNSHDPEYDSFEFSFDQVLNEGYEKQDTFSVSDVQYILKMLENQFPNQGMFRFTFAVRTIYSIILNKMFCNNLLHEIRREPYDLWEITTFIGGDLFGVDVDRYISHTNDDDSRSSFTIHLDAVSSKMADEFTKKMADTEFAFFTALFCYFEFPRSSQNISYKNRYRSVGNYSPSKRIIFNATYPILNLIQPKNIFERIEKISAPDQEQFYHESLSLLCANILTNINLVNRLNSDLQNRSLVRTSSWNFSDYIIDMFERIEKALKSIDYLPLNCDMSALIKYLRKNESILNLFYALFEQADRKIVNTDDLKHIVSTVSGLKTKIMTKTFEELEASAENLQETLVILNNYYGAPMSTYINRIDDLLLSIQDFRGEMDATERDTYQKAYNQIVRELKGKYLLQGNKS